jgi:AcrR family transcriptional regulator
MTVTTGKNRELKIDRAVVIDTARRVIDTDGLAALTIRRIATELGVRSSSLYHHFRTKEDIVQEVLANAMATLEMPQAPMRWPDLLVELCRRYWTVLVNNRHLIPTLAGRPHERFGPEIARQVADSMLGGGVPAKLVYTFTEQTEALTLGSATFAVVRYDETQRRENDRPEVLEETFHARVKSEEERFLVGVRAMVRGFEELVAQLNTSTTTRSNDDSGS